MRNWFSLLVVFSVLLLNQHLAFADANRDGTLTITGLPTDDTVLQCTCGSDSFPIALTQATNNLTLSLAKFWQTAEPHMSKGAGCSFVQGSENHAFDLTNCQLQSVHPDSKTGKIVDYAKVTINGLGNHYFKSGFAMAAFFTVTPNNGDYTAQSSSVDNDPVNHPCIDNGNVPSQYQLCDGKNCCNAWNSSIFATTSGTVNITGGPDGLQAVCTKPSGQQITFTNSHDDPPNPPKGVVVDLQTTHDQFGDKTYGDNVTANCKLEDKQQNNYGTIELQNINGSRVSNKTKIGHIWSTIVSVTEQPPVVDYKINAPAADKTSDSAIDSGKTYYNIWNVNLVPNRFPGSVTLANIPQGLTTNCASTTTDKNLVIDFEKTHAQTSSDPTKDVTTDCNLKINTINYGTLTLTDLDGNRTSDQNPGSSIWSATVSVKTQPDANTHLKLNSATVDAKSQSAEQNKYHNLFDVSFQPAAALTIAGTVPGVTITTTCKGNGKSYQAPSNTISLRGVHQALDTNDSDTFNVTCSMQGSDGTSYGAIVLEDLNGSRKSNVPADPDNIWSAYIAASDVTQPDAVTGYKLDKLTPSGQVDSSGKYHTLWSITLEKPSE